MIIASLACASAASYALDLSPNQNGGSGAIPGNQQQINFYLGDGNYAPRVTLPASGLSGATIKIASNATYSTEVALNNTSIPIPSVTLNTGESMSFAFDASKKRWMYQPVLGVQSPNRQGAQVKIMDNEKVALYRIGNGDWTSAVRLPVSAKDGSLAMVESLAAWTSSIDRANVLFGSTMNLRTADSYVFTYRADLRKWVPIGTPSTTLVANNDFGTWQLSAPVTPRTRVEFHNGAHRPAVSLPATAGDRDRVTLYSAASWGVTIDPRYTQYKGSMVISTGQTYEFMFVKELNAWVTLRAPTLTYSAPAPSPTSFSLPAQLTPVMRYTSRDGVWAGQVVLPGSAKVGDQVVVESTATYGFNVVANDRVLNTVNKGDLVRYVYGAGGWTPATRAITMLMVYSDQAAQLLGEAGAQLRLTEGLRLTNEALENSNANFYVKSVGFLKRKVPGSTLDDAVSLGRTDTAIQTARQQRGANAVYYEGTEDGCGLAWVNASASYMIATGSLNCGTTVMRHEFGHNMGLGHCPGDYGSATYTHGQAETRDAMCGNAIPYFSTPKLYDSETGLALGKENITDGVRAMNERSATVSTFR